MPCPTRNLNNNLPDLCRCRRTRGIRIVGPLMSVRQWSYIANGRVRRRAHPLLMVCVDAVEGCPEVVEDDGVAEAFEDEGELGREGCVSVPFFRCRL